MSNMTYPTIADAMSDVKAAFATDTMFLEDQAIVTIDDSPLILVSLGGVLYAAKESEETRTWSILILDRDVPEHQKAIDKIKMLEQIRKNDVERMKKAQERHQIMEQIAVRCGSRVVYKDGRLYVDGFPFHDLSIVEEYPGGRNSYRSDRNSARLVVRIEGYTGSGRRPHRYPRRLDGTFNWSEIISTLMSRANSLQAQRDSEKKRSQNKVVVDDAFRKSLQPLCEYGIRPSSDPERPVAVSVKILQTMTVEQVKALAEALRGLDFKLNTTY